MKITELIKELTETLQKHGDHDVIIADGFDIAQIKWVSFYDEKDITPHGFYIRSTFKEDMKKLVELSKEKKHNANRQPQNICPTE